MKRLARRIMMFDDSAEASKNVSKKRKISLVKENAAAAIIAPRFRFNGNVEDVEWQSSQEKVNQATTTNDARVLRASLVSISRGIEERASATIIRFLRDSRQETIAKYVYNDLHSSDAGSKDLRTAKIIVDGIRACVKHHTNGSGTRKKEAEMLVKGLAIACLFGLLTKDTNVSKQDVINLTGITHNQLEQALSKVQGMISNGLADGYQKQYNGTHK
jgi:hypothetical protein